MNDGNFASRLKQLMAAYRLTSKDLAKEMEITTRSVNRYLAGDVVPTKVKQQEIINAIERLSGVQISTSLNLTLQSALDSGTVTFRTDEEILAEEVLEMEEAERQACGEFAKLLPVDQKKIADHLDVYLNMSAYELIMLESFTVIDEAKKEFILENLRIAQFKYKDICSNDFVCNKIASYMQMMLELTDYEHIEVTDEEVLECQRRFSDAMKRAAGICVEQIVIVLKEVASMDTKDWYLLMLIQMAALGDKGSNLVEGGYIGDRVYVLYSYLRKLAEEAE